MSKLNVYIDFMSVDNEENFALAKRISERIKWIKPKVNVLLFTDIKAESVWTKSGKPPNLHRMLDTGNLN